MIPGESIPQAGSVELNAGRDTLTVSNMGDRPVQVGSYLHFFETNRALEFDRERAYGMRLLTALREPTRLGDRSPT